MKTVLIIEDDVDLLENMKAVLEQQDYQTFTTSDSSLGIRLSRRNDPDLVLCDVMMPRVNGYDVLTAIRQHQTTAATPVVFVTGKSERSAVRHGMNLGADDYLTKPFTTTELLEVVSGCLSRQEHLARQYALKSKEVERLTTQVKNLQDLASTNHSLFQRIAENLRHPFSNINLALSVVRETESEAERDRFLKILQEECDRGTALLNEAAGMQEFLTYDKFNVLRQLRILDQPEAKRCS
jgi:two-component system, OmpR family, alkaline phosphatase synthesis response regulator PhoP